VTASNANASSQASRGIGRDGIRRPDLVVLGFNRDVGGVATITGEHKYQLSDAIFALTQGIVQLLSAYQSMGTYLGYALAADRFSAS
jgi:hypothetical protein